LDCYEGAERKITIFFGTPYTRCVLALYNLLPFLSSAVQINGQICRNRQGAYFAIYE